MRENKEFSDVADISVDGASFFQEESPELMQEWEKLGITSDFIFCKVMQDKDLLRELIGMILPDLMIEDLDITPQKPVELGKDIHGVRFDVYVKSNDGTVIDIEMQVLNRGNLPKRLRYYGSMCDGDMLEKGILYSAIKDCYIIAICPFDFYGKGLHRYTFTNRCHESAGLEMGDGTTKIVLNANGTTNDVQGRLMEFLNYVAGKPSDDEYIKKLDEAVCRARQNKEWRREYMDLMMRDLEKIEEGIEKGIEKEKIRQVERLLKKGKSIDEIADLLDYPLDFVKSVQERLLIVN